MKIITTILCLLAIACQAGTNDIVISSSFTKIEQPGKTPVYVTQPIVLGPADKFDLRFKPHEVEVWTRAEPMRFMRFADFGYQEPFDKSKSHQRNVERWVKGLLVAMDVAEAEGVHVDVPEFIRSIRQTYASSTTLKTNWTAIENGAREVGLIVEEDVATIVHKGKTNRFVLESKEVGTTGPRKFHTQWLIITNTVWDIRAGGGTVTYDDSDSTITTSTDPMRRLIK